MDTTTALDWAGTRRLGVLITIRSDGRPQSSDVIYAIIDGAIVVSVTADRAKTRNMRRDPRIVLHVTDAASWSYIAFDGVVELSPVASTPQDDTTDALVAYYHATNDHPHPNWDHYRQAMVDEQRLLATLRPTSAVGQIHK